MGRVYNVPFCPAIQYAQYGHAQVRFFESGLSGVVEEQHLVVVLPHKVHVTVRRCKYLYSFRWHVEVTDGAGRRWTGDGIDIEGLLPSVLDADLVCEIAHVLSVRDTEWLHGVIELAMEKWPQITKEY